MNTNTSTYRNLIKSINNRSIALCGGRDLLKTAYSHNGYTSFANPHYYIQIRDNEFEFPIVKSDYMEQFYKERNIDAIIQLASIEVPLPTIQELKAFIKDNELKRTENTVRIAYRLAKDYWVNVFYLLDIVTAIQNPVCYRAKKTFKPLYFVNKEDKYERAVLCPIRTTDETHDYHLKNNAKLR